MIVATATALPLLATAGCSSAVTVQAPEQSAACTSVLAAAPIRLVGELQRETTPHSAAAIAWGDPPIVLVCGLNASTTADAQVIDIDGLEWIAEPIGVDGAQGTIFTTRGRVPVIQVRVPADYRPEIDAVTELSSLLP